MVGGKDDWIIEDSEEEDELCTSELDAHPSQGPSVSAGPVLPEDAISSIKPFTSVPVENTSLISTFGTDHQARPTISTFTPPPHVDLSTISEASSKRNSKPRPRPIFRCTSDNPSRNVSISDPILPHTPTSDPNDRLMVMARSDSMAGKGATTDIDPESNNFSPDIAERAKMRNRKATRRSPQYTEDVVDITDDDLAASPVRKPKEKPKPRPIVRAAPVANHPQLPSDPVTIPLPSSSPLLPPSDLFLASTAINSTPPQSYTLDAVVVPDSPGQQSPINRKKRKRTDHHHSPIDDPPDPNWPTTVRASVASPRLDPPSPSEDNFGVSRAVDLGQPRGSDEAENEHRHDVKTTPKKRKGLENTENDDDSVSTRPEGIGITKSKTKKKTILEVVITSPRKQGKKKAKVRKKDNRSSEGSSSKSRNDRPASPFTSAVKPVEDDGHIPHQTSDDEDELILAPKKRTSSRAKPRKRAAVSDEEGEEPGKSDHPAEGASTSCDNGDHISRSRPTEPETPAPHQKNPKPSGTVQEDHRPKPDPTNETPVSGKLRYTLSRFDQKTPMRELIRRATSHPNAPFSASSSPVASPLAKTSKSTLRRIAPLHPIRRTPPPPPPRPPPPKKSKKMNQLEEKWEMELEDEVEGWWALTDEERQSWRRAKREKELGYDD